MRLTPTLSTLLLFSTPLLAQETVGFEDFALEPDTFRNGAALDTSGFMAGQIFLPNSYTATAEFSFWSGWSLSSMRDTVTPGFMNQYSAITGAGAEGSPTYAVGFGGGTAIRLSAGPALIEGLSITNTTYAALSMRDGDQFAKRFGGATGDDPDFFSVSFRGWSGGERSADSVTVFLADYRGGANEDFILEEWQAVDLSTLGAVDSLTVSFASSDVGTDGINTPRYVAIDNIVVGQASSLADFFRPAAPRVFPNPASTSIQLAVDVPGDYEILDSQGRRVAEGRTAGPVDIAGLSPGLHYVRVQTPRGWSAGTPFLRSR